MAEDGYVEETTIVTMRFSGKRAGLVIHTQEPSADTWGDEISPLLAYMTTPLRFVDLFIKHLDSWNLKRKDGTSVPATRQGFMSQNIHFVEEVLKAWINNGILVAAEEEPPPSEEEEEVDPFEGRNIQVISMDDYAPEGSGDE